MSVIAALPPPPSSSSPPSSGLAPPGAPPGAPVFESALAEQWARTANAEGQQQPSSQALSEELAAKHGRSSQDAGGATVETRIEAALVAATIVPQNATEQPSAPSSAQPGAGSTVSESGSGDPELTVAPAPDSVATAEDPASVGVAQSSTAGAQAPPSSTPAPGPGPSALSAPGAPLAPGQDASEPPTPAPAAQATAQSERPAPSVPAQPGEGSPAAPGASSTSGPYAGGSSSAPATPSSSLLTTPPAADAPAAHAGVGTPPDTTASEAAAVPGKIVAGGQTSPFQASPAGAEAQSAPATQNPSSQTGQAPVKAQSPSVSAAVSSQAPATSASTPTREGSVPSTSHTSVSPMLGSDPTGADSSGQPGADQAQIESPEIPTEQSQPTSGSSQHPTTTGPLSTTEASVQAVTDFSAPAQAAPAPSPGQPARPAVGMQEMIDSIRATVEIAARQGIAQARIALAPAELGHISIRLSQTSEGLLARVSAETPAAAQALASGRSELRQSLSSLGLTLLRLDIGSFSSSETNDRDRFAGSAEDPRLASTSTAPEDGETVGELDGVSRPSGVARGELVDVLA